MAANYSRITAELQLRLHRTPDGRRRTVDAIWSLLASSSARPADALRDEVTEAERPRPSSVDDVFDLPEFRTLDGKEERDLVILPNNGKVGKECWQTLAEMCPICVEVTSRIFEKYYTYSQSKAER